jgi:hypothetical protein
MEIHVGRILLRVENDLPEFGALFGAAHHGDTVWSHSKPRREQAEVEDRLFEETDGSVFLDHSGQLECIPIGQTNAAV